jgi:hypothetical protein
MQPAGGTLEAALLHGAPATRIETASPVLDQNGAGLDAGLVDQLLTAPGTQEQRLTTEHSLRTHKAAENAESLAATIGLTEEV